jgi:presenilin-like A22 family membrane protease
MKSELVLAFILFLLLIIKVGKEVTNERLLSLIQILLLGNFIYGFFFIESGSLFGGMYITNGLIAFQKSIIRNKNCEKKYKV